ncbi:VanW family protein [Patescibacteria group bacterium]|nr:VanW family protein [Patescibacteria group bacterium]
MTDTKKTSENRMKLDTATLKAFVTWTSVTIGVLAFFFMAAAGGAIAYAKLYDGRIFPGVRVLDVRLDGLMKEEARQAVQTAIDAALTKGLRFTFRGAEVNLGVTIPATADPDASRDLIRYGIDQSIEEAYDTGRGDGWLRDIAEQLNARARPRRIAADITFDGPGIEDALKVALKEHLVSVEDASFSIVVATGSAPFIHIENERSGVTYRTEKAMETLRRQVESLTFEPIALEEETARPAFTRDDLENLTDEVMEILQRPKLVFTYDGTRYPIPTSTLAAWIVVHPADGRPSVGIDEEKFAASIRAIVPGIEQEVKNGSLVIKDGVIESFVPGTQGVAFDVSAILASVQASWPPSSTFPLVVKTISGSILGDDPERLGIKEIIGVGRSDFSGSPSNRRGNIRKGAEKVNGTIIAPGEEFSLLKTLGPIDGANGWLPELVIKGNKTTPEYGGGLCQIGTTTFRGSVNSGLRITERRNHSYRVSYYEPAGTDATIYDPAPDFKFMNDTAHHVLINAYLKGNEVVFEFWGTEDGRVVDPIKPRIYNIVSPPAMKLIETLDLEPGKKKCTESAHAGADAEFTYHITYVDGTEHEEVFSSHYRPWQAVCLVGVEKLSEPETDADATPAP